MYIFFCFATHLICICILQTNEVPDVLYECVIEVDERVVLQQNSCQLHLDAPTLSGVTGEQVSDR